MKKSMIAFVLLCVTIIGTCFYSNRNNNSSYSACNIITEQNSTMKEDEFDYYEEIKTENSITVYAQKNIVSNEIPGIENVNLNNEQMLTTSYSVEYDMEEEIVYLIITICNQEGELLSSQMVEAYPIYYSDGSIDALFDIDGKYLYLSEINNGESENCFFLSLALSYFASKAVVAVVAVGAAVFTASVVVEIGKLLYKAEK